MIDPITKLLYRGAGRHGPVAVMYHSVSLGSGVPDWPWALSAQRFRAHLDLLADGDWTTVTVRDLLDRRSVATPRTIAITFMAVWVASNGTWRRMTDRRPPL